MSPDVEGMKTYRVVVSTCFSASTPYGIGVPRGHFTHIFIDEAGQACEPEVMIPIKTMADTKTNIIFEPSEGGEHATSTAPLHYPLPSVASGEQLLHIFQ